MLWGESWNWVGSSKQTLSDREGVSSSLSHQHTHRHTHKLQTLLAGLSVPLKHLSIDICLEPGSPPPTHTLSLCRCKFTTGYVTVVLNDCARCDNMITHKKMMFLCFFLKKKDVITPVITSINHFAHCRRVGSDALFPSAFCVKISSCCDKHKYYKETVPRWRGLHL